MNFSTRNWFFVAFSYNEFMTNRNHLSLPKQSKIQVMSQDDCFKLIFPVSSRSIALLVPFIFLLIWTSTITYMWVLSAYDLVEDPVLFLSLELILMFFSLILMFTVIYKGLRKPQPEIIEVDKENFYHVDSIEPIGLWNTFSRADFFINVFKIFPRSLSEPINNISNLQLIHYGNNSKLVYDVGIERYEIGKTISLGEKEAIYSFLRNIIRN